MVNNMILCGECGLGKTSYVKKNWNTAIYVNGEYTNLYAESYGPLLGVAEEHVYQGPKDDPDKLFSFFVELLSQESTVVIDQVELINKSIFKKILRVCKFINVKQIIFLFDKDSKLVKNEYNYKMIIRYQLLPYDYRCKNFRVSNEEYEQFIGSKYPELHVTEYNKLLELTEYNFYNMMTLLYIKDDLKENSKTLTEKLIQKYVYENVYYRLHNLDEEWIDILKRSSVIGKIFDSSILKYGFKITQVKKILEEIKDLHTFIVSVPNCDDKKYGFISKDIHSVVYECNSTHDKKKYAEILKRYYHEKLETVDDYQETLQYLIYLKNIECELENDREVRNVNLKLLYTYQKIYDYEKCLDIINDILSQEITKDNDVFTQYLIIYKIRLLTDKGEFSKALKLIKKIIRRENFKGDHHYLSYYNAYCCYNCGKVKSAFSQCKELLDSFDQKEQTIAEEQYPIYSLVLSLNASLLHHLDEPSDNGVASYNKALHYAKKIEHNKEIYYGILRKCDMYYPYDKAKECLLNAADFYKKYRTSNILGQIYFNLATLMLMEDSTAKLKMKEYFDISYSIFNDYCNEMTAYSKNNIAIYYILEENDIAMALNELCLAANIIDLSDFTYMTIYLNICMCFLLQRKTLTKEFKHARNKFTKYIRKLKKRKLATKYEEMYENLVDLLIEEQMGLTSKVITLCQELLNKHDENSFFHSILEDILVRNGSTRTVTYKKNRNFYTKINEKKIFLAEFRFWE